MFKLLAALPLLIVSPGAFAQSVPDDAHKVMWCALAFQIFFVDPHRSSVEEIEVFKPYADAAKLLLDHGRASLAAAGFSDEAANQVRRALVPEVTRQVNREEAAEFTTTDCAALAKAHGAAAGPETVSLVSPAV
ncbi:MAG: hypothetical protein ABIO40_01225 [Devosia sp.]